MEGYIRLFEYYKQLGDKALAQLSEEDSFFWSPSPESNSIAIIVQHLYGNMLSRWTDFLTSDGEKEWRNRDQEFELYVKDSSEIRALWNKGWTCLFQALEEAKDSPTDRLVYIRSKGHTIEEAVQRQLAHYAYHVGQLVYVARIASGEDWKSLSIAKGGSEAYNLSANSPGKRKEHFTEQFNKTT